MILLLLISMILSGMSVSPVGAEEYEEKIHEDKSGAVKNRIGSIEYEDSLLSKKAKYTGTPGEYYIDLFIEGKTFESTETTDIVVVYDNSNSMNENNRDTISHEATSDFVSEILSPENNKNGNIRMALITYGTDVFDGRNSRVYNLRTDNLSHKELTTNADDIISKLPRNVPNERSQGNNGGTFTQAALKEAESILKGSDADNQHIITLTDGVPTLSYNPDGQVTGNGTSFTYRYHRNDRTHGQDTIAEAKEIQKNGIMMSSIGIEISGGSQATYEEAIGVMEGIASSPEQYYGVEQVSDLSTILKEISSSLTKSIVNGTVTDPMGDLFNLKKTDGNFQAASSEELVDGDYYLSSSAKNLLNGVKITIDDETITLKHLNLGKDEWINLRYKVNLDTENEKFVPNTYFPTNGPTFLQANGTNNETIRDFPIPKAFGAPVNISGTKNWEDYNQTEYRPESIVVELWKKATNGEDILLEEKVVTGRDDWSFTFENYPKYDSKGSAIGYFVKESSINGYEPTYSKQSYDITNTLIEKPALAINKSSDLQYFTKVGQVITYTFEVKNTGNVPLTNIKVIDEMIGKSIELETTTLLPSETTFGTTTYEVTQEDLDNGGITNIATVTGKTPKGNTTEDEGTDYVPSSGAVTVKHVDEEGKELALSEELTGNVGESYKTTEKEIDGYELIEVPGNATGAFTEEPQTVTYVYKPVKVPGAPVIVKHVDEEGKELAPSEELTGNVGDQYETVPEKIDGYELIEVPDNANGEFTGKPQTVTYVYKLLQEESVKAAPVTVNHVDEAGKELAPSEELRGNLGNPYKTASKEIDGYELIKVPGNATGAFTEEPQTVTYVYKPVKVAGAPVTVEHVDEEGKELAPSEELTGNIGEIYETTETEIDGYELIEVLGNATGAFTEEPQTITYVYKPVKVPGAPVIVEHVDEEGKELAPSEELTGNIGESYETTEKEIDGYELIEVPGNASGAFTEEPQTVTYVYKPVKVTGAPVTVEHVDETGKRLAPSEELTGNIGESYETSEKEIDGYELIEVPGNATGAFTEETQTVTYVYMRVKEELTPPASPVIVEYVDIEGNPIAVSEELTGNIGDSYQSSPKDIDGYKLIEVKGNEKGEFGENRQTVIYIYEKVTAPESPEVVGEKEKGTGTGSDSKPTSGSGEKLPNTASNIFNFLTLGLVFILSGIIIGFVYNRRQKLS